MFPKAIIFDLGGVFIKHVFKIRDEYFLNAHTAKKDAVRKFYSSQYFDFEKGKISSEKFFQKIREKLGYQFSYPQFRIDICDAFEMSLDEKMFQFLLELKRNLPPETEFWILSNLNEIHHSYILEHWPHLFVQFHKIFLSYELGCRKPEPAIYDALFQETNINPNDCVFIDDLAINGVYPKQIGMYFIQFKGLYRLRWHLSKLNIFKK